ncbi:hypothetical protein GCM10010233_44270 [Streptomyces pseudogriseolus]|nr:hypothetical protein GCM10010233_44270 [Streptomyces gancidicus]
MTGDRLGWRACLLGGAVFAVCMTGTTLPTPLYPLYQQKFGFSELTVTVVYAVYAFAVIGALLLVGNASDAVGRRPVLLWGLVCAGASAVCFLLATGIAWLYAGRLLSGLRPACSPEPPQRTSWSRLRPAGPPAPRSSPRPSTWAASAADPCSPGSSPSTPPGRSICRTPST